MNMKRKEIMTNTKTIVATVLAGVLAFAGCVSVESTKEQLNSGDPKQVAEAEDWIYGVCSDADLSYSFREEYLALATKNALLVKIIKGTRENDVRMIAAAASKIDLSKPGVGKEILRNHRDVMQRVDAVQLQMGNKSKRSDRVRTQRNSRGSENAVASPEQSQDLFSDKVIATLSEKDFIQALSSDKIDGEMKDRLAKRLLSITQDKDVLMSFYDGDLKSYVDYMARKDIVLRLAKMPDKLDKPDEIIKILDERLNGVSDHYVQEPEMRAKLLSRLPDDVAVEYAMKSVDAQSVAEYKGMMLEFEDALAVMKLVKDTGSVNKIALAMLVKIDSYREKCKDSWTTNWGNGDMEKANALVKRFPKFSDAEIEELICSSKTSWQYLIDRVSADVAYGMLAKGTAKTGDLELALVKRLSDNRIDMKVYNSVKFDDSKKAINARMTPEMKKAAAAEMEKAFAGICEKAKAASKETFELDGFYLGMSFDDMKVVFTHHFPDMEIKEAIDGKGKNADNVIYVPGQSLPFCYAGVGDKKVYQFNFGKKLLKKWYKYDVQTPMEWAYAYGRETKADMRYKMIEADKTIYDLDMSNGNRVWFHQESYQFKHNTKEYRLTYFGEEKDYTVEGGIVGDLIKEAAAKYFHYIRGDVGSLRAQIERE